MCENNAGNNPSAIVHADLTLTMQLPKLAFFFAENHKFTGEVKVLDIRLHPEGLKELDSSITAIEKDEIRQLLKPRDPYAHKGNMGHALLVGGRYGMAGAAVLAAKACLRSGAGKLTIHSAELNNNVLQCCVPEAILSHDLSDIIVSKAINTYNYNVMAVGPDWALMKKQPRLYIHSSETTPEKSYSMPMHSTSWAHTPTGCRKFRKTACSHPTRKNWRIWWDSAPTATTGWSSPVHWPSNYNYISSSKGITP